MRKIRNQRIQSADPALLFARGIEQLVDDQLHHPGRNDRSELEKLQRQTKQPRAGSVLFHLILRPFSI